MRICWGIFAVLLIVSCTQKNGDKHSLKEKQQIHADNKLKNKWTDTLSYTIKGGDTTDAACRNTNNCAHVSLTYPMFHKQPGLNHYIREDVLGQVGLDSAATIPLDKAIRQYIGEYVSQAGTAETDSDANITAETDDYNITIIRQDSSLIVLDIYQEHSGGAHPVSDEEFVNWDTKKDKEIVLDDLFIKDYSYQLNKIAEKIFRKDQGLKPGEPLTNYFFEDGVFPLNDNFKITPEGLTFFYNMYEIQSYINGDTELTIPYKLIKHLLRPRTVISQFIK